MDLNRCKTTAHVLSLYRLLREQIDRNGIILRVSYVRIRLKTAMNYELLLLKVSSILGAEKINVQLHVN